MSDFCEPPLIEGDVVESTWNMIAYKYNLIILL
jgi:hypothetical protein